MALVQPPVLLDRQPQPPHRLEREVEGLDRPRLDAGEAEVEIEPARRHQLARQPRLLDALRGQVDVPPAGEAILEVPRRLAVADEDEAWASALAGGELVERSRGGRRGRRGRGGRLRSGDQPRRGSGRSSLSLNGISSVIETAPKRSASWAVDIDMLASPGFGDLIALARSGNRARRATSASLNRSNSALLRLVPARYALEAGEEIGGDRLVAMDVHREIDAGPVHLVADAEHFRAALRRSGRAIRG